MMRIPVGVSIVFFLSSCSMLHSPPQLPGSLSDTRVLLPNGWILSPAGKSIDLGDFPLGMDISPDGRLAVVVNSGQGQQTISIVNIEKKSVIQTLPIKKSWRGVRFQSTGDRFFVIGGNDQVVYRYALEHDSAWFLNSIYLTNPKLRDPVSPTDLDLNREGSLMYVVSKGNYWMLRVNSFDDTVLDTLVFDKAMYSCLLDEKRRLVYVSIWGGSEIAIVDADSLAVKASIAVGDHPTEMVMTKDAKFLFVANANNNTVSVVDLDARKAVETISTAVSPDAPNGSTPNSLALSEDDKTLYVANADNNYIAVVDVERGGQSKSKGFIPSGWYPTVVRRSGSLLLIANGKGGSSQANVHGEYIASLLKGTLSFVSVPDEGQLRKYTTQVYQNTPLTRNTPRPTWEESNPVPKGPGRMSPIKHVFYIVKENRTYDQMFGDMPQGNGDSSICIFGRAVTPNHHALAEEFVLLDNFYVDAEVSADGHNWSMGAYATDYVEKTWPTLYGGRGGEYDFEKEGIASASDGYLWDLCICHGVSLRNYGEFVDEEAPQHGGERVGTKSLAPYTAPLFRGWDLKYSDRARAKEWLREFNDYERGDSLPQFQIIRLPNDHTAGTRRGNLTPRAMVADNDQALGTIVERISHSKYWKESAVFVLEDDAQDGPDHVDAHRSIALVVSPYTKRRQVDHTMYSTSGMLRTIELILGLPPMSQYDASAMPMFASFTSTPDFSPYLIKPAMVDLDEHNLAGAYGQERMETMNLDREDAAPDQEFNEIIWKSVRGSNSRMPPPVRNAFVRIVEEKQ